MDNEIRKYERRRKDILIFPNLLMDLREQNLRECLKRITPVQTTIFTEILENIEPEERIHLLIKNKKVVGISGLKTLLKRCSE